MTLHAPSSGFLRRRLAPIVCWLSLLLGSRLLAEPVKFDIPAQPAPAAIQLFMKQSGVEILFKYEDLAKASASAVQGSLEPADALDQLLVGTGCTATPQGKNKFLVRPREKAKVTTGSIKGSLTGENGRPASGVSVIVRETGQSTRTDGNGEFELAQVDPGKYLLVAQAEGYQPMHIEGVRVQAGRELTLGTETMRRSDGIEKLEPFVVQAETVTQLEKYEVNDSKAKPFADRNVDLPRGIDDVQPYYIFDSRKIEQVGSVNVEDFLKTRLTMNTNDLSNTQSYPNGTSLPGNTSKINLRGLGANQTLILVNGRRSPTVVSAFGQIFQSDVNGIPIAAIDRIEVLPSSASGIYGGGAVGGVINIVLKKDYQGGEVKYTYDNPFDTDAPLRTTDLSYGMALEGGRTHATFSAHYSDGKVMLTGDRRSLAQHGYDIFISRVPVGYLTNGANFPNLGAEPNLISNGGTAILTFKSGGSLNSIYATIVPGTTVTTPAAFLPGQYNLSLPESTQAGYGLLSALGSVPLTKGLSASLNRQMNSWLELFAEFSISSNSTRSLYDPWPFQSGGGGVVPAASPVNPFNQAVRVNFPEVTVVPNSSSLLSRTITSGAIIQFPAGWRGELDYTWSSNSFHSANSSPDTTQTGGFNAALATGAFNPFVDTLATHLDLTPYLASVQGDSRSTFNDVAFRVSGPFFALPWGRLTLSVALEHRQEGSGNANFYQYYPKNPSYNTQDIVYGQNQVIDSAYIEADIPLIRERSNGLRIHSLTLQLATRDELYRVTTGTTGVHIPVGQSASYTGPTANGLPFRDEVKYAAIHPTAGVLFKPIEDLALRVSYATGFLPPSISDLTPNVPRIDNYTTPIDDPVTGQSYDIQTVSGGNPNITPEKSKNWDFGVIYEPKEWLRGLRLNVEYYHIEKDNVIGSLDPQSIISAGSTFSSRITRDPATHLITLVDASTINLAKLVTSGWDISADYQRATSIGQFELFGSLTAITHYQQQLGPGTPLLEYAGYVPDGGPAKTKGNITLTWERGPLAVGWSTTCFGSYYQRGAPGSPIYNGDATAQPGGTVLRILTAQGSTAISSQTYHSVFASYKFGGSAKAPWTRKLASDLTLQVGVKNLFNTYPPFDANRRPYFYSTYGDPRLRDYWVSVRKTF